MFLVVDDRKLWLIMNFCGNVYNRDNYDMELHVKLE